MHACLPMYKYATCVPVPTGPERVLDPLTLELQMIGSHHVCSGN